MAEPRVLLVGEMLYPVCSECFERFAALNVCEDCGARPKSLVVQVAQGLIYFCDECNGWANTEVAVIAANWPNVAKHASYFRDPRIPTRRGRTEAEADRRHVQCVGNELIGEWGLSARGAAAMAKKRLNDPMARVTLKEMAYNAPLTVLNLKSERESQ